MARFWKARQMKELAADHGFHLVGDFNEVAESLGGEDKAATDLRLSFQPFQIRVQLIFRDTFATLDFIHAPVNLGIDGLTVGREPRVLLVQHI